MIGVRMVAISLSRIVGASIVMLCTWCSSASELQPLDDNSHGLSRYLLQFESQGLHQYALYIVGSNQGFSALDLVVVAHGYHPNPPDYGKLANGDSRRPGNYYRQWVEAYALAGFNVLVPDYRGHNQSQGFGFTHQGGKVKFPEQYYARDLLASIEALEQQMRKDKQIENIALVGHSMGGPIAFYAASQLAEKVKLVSLWSSAKYRFEQDKKNPFDIPFILHHGDKDTTTPISNTDYYRQNFSDNLLYQGVYNTEQHMLTQADFATAIAIDIRFIKHYFHGQSYD
ncbi:alpha/beta hydrolase [Thalassotalea litorea]|uniref:Alpha/beta hydrolase n=1 Tax=Thalassotalea litorea TaxID=2020715 RepID=A0A5R9IQN4_9GAMM|nr:alpha/beta fold hydrolase [Thalassotalea litorea]TLU66909.1 alpha/beta hydrolase [Thalassotalea litorea]